MVTAEFQKKSTGALIASWVILFWYFNCKSTCNLWRHCLAFA